MIHTVEYDYPAFHLSKDCCWAEVASGDLKLKEQEAAKYISGRKVLAMKPKSEKSIELYKTMIRRGYPEEFCDAVTKNLNTDFTAKRMIGYLSHYEHLPLEEIVDEMLAILSDRNRIMEKKELENINTSWNRHMMQGFDEDV